MRKNVAGQVIGAQLVSASDGSAFTGSVTVAVTGDGGTQATGSVGSGACTHEGGGYHTYTPAQAETNYDLIAFTFSGSGAIPVTVQVFTVNAKLTAAAIANMEVVYVTDFATNYSTANDQWSVSSSAVASVTGGINTSGGAITTLDALDTAQDAQHGTTQTELAKVPKSDSNVTWNATALASIKAEVDSALADYDAPTNTEMVAAFTEIKGATWATTDTLEAIRDRGDAAWVTATGFSTHSAADVWAAVDRTLTANTNLNDPTAAAIADAVLSRNVSNVEGSAPEHSLCTIVLASLESSISDTTWTIKRTDGSTTHYTKTVTVDDTADPITGVS